MAQLIDEPKQGEDESKTNESVLDGASEEVSREALRKAGTKLPLKTRIVAR